MVAWTGCVASFPILTFETSTGAIALAPKSWDIFPALHGFTHQATSIHSNPLKKREETKGQLQRFEPSDDGENSPEI
jgi:hypothetical protein